MATSNTPLVSVIVPTHGRHEFLPRAVESALAQTVTDLEVVVVDDASHPPVRVPQDPRVRLVRLEVNRGIAGALTHGARAARGRWIAHVDDDDVLLPNMLEISLRAAAGTDLPRPVAVLSGIELVDPDGRVLQRRLPPTRALGDHFSLEPRERGCAYETRNTMVVEREVLERVGYWDERFRSRARNDLFLRMNPVCSIVGIPIVTYRQLHHAGPRVSTDTRSKHESFRLLESKHRALFASHPDRYAHYLAVDAARLLALGQRADAVKAVGDALRLSPRSAVRGLARLAWTAAVARRPRGASDDAGGRDRADDGR